MPILGKRRLRDDLVTTYDFLKVIDDVDSELFFKRYRDRASSGDNMKLDKTYKKGVKKHMYSIRMVDQWNRLTEDLSNAGRIHKFKTQKSHKCTI